MMDFIRKHDILYKLLALALAIGFWFYVMGVKDPEINLTLHKVPVNYIGEDALSEELGFGIISGRESAIDVRVVGTRSQVISMKSADLTVNVDLTGIVTPGVHNVPYNVILPDKNVSLADNTGHTLSLFIDAIREIEVPVVAKIIGEAAEGYTCGAPVLNPTTVKISGPASQVSNISHALVEIRTGTISQSFYGDYAYKFINRDGSEFSSEYAVLRTDKISATVPVYMQKTVPLKVLIHETGGLSEENVSVSITPKEITIAGEKAVLDSIDSITLGTVSMDDVSDSGFSTVMEVSMPDGITNVSGIAKADVNITLKNVTTRSFTVTNFRVEGAPEGKNVTVSDGSKKITLRGSESFLNGLSADDLILVVDASQVSGTGRKSLRATAALATGTDVLMTESCKVTVSVSAK